MYEMEYNFKKIGARIRAERKMLRLSQQELCDKINLSQRATLGRFEAGTSEIPLWVLVELCRVFDCELGYLLCEHNEKTRLNADICEITGLSESAVNHIIALNQEPKRLFNEGNYNVKPKILSQILEDDNFKDLIDSVFDYCYTKSNGSLKDEDFKLFRIQNNFVRIVEKIKNSK